LQYTPDRRPQQCVGVILISIPAKAGTHISASRAIEA